MKFVNTTVLVPYKITLLSNGDEENDKIYIVLVPYKITLLSNALKNVPRDEEVLVPYKITLLSNLKFEFKCRYGRHV